MITPDTVNEVEYVPFIDTFVVTDPLTSLPAAITSVTLTASDGADYTNTVTITILPGMFIVSGNIADVFHRQMKYLDTGAVPGVVGRFQDIPVSYETLYHYTGPYVNSITLILTCVSTAGTDVAHIIVRNNWEVANAKLVNYVKMGKY